MVYVFRMKLEDRSHIRSPVILEERFSNDNEAILFWKNMFFLAASYLEEGYIVTEVLYRREVEALPAPPEGEKE